MLNQIRHTSEIKRDRNVSMHKILKRFRYGERGFTLIELLVAIAIIGTLAGVAVPSVGKFINQGKTEAMETELDNVQVAVQVAMADAGVSEIANINEGAHKNLGDADHNPDTAGKDRKIAKVGSVKYFVGDYIAGDVDSLQGHYWLYRDGTVKTRWYPDLGIIN